MKKSILLYFASFLSFLLPAQNLTDSLKAYYSFSGNAQDQSGYGQNGIVHNATLVPDRFGNANSAYYFNGYSSYIEVPTSIQTRPSTFPVSFSAWVKFSTSSGIPFPVFASDYTSSGDYHGFWMNFFAGSNEIAASYGNGGPCTGSSRVSKIGTTNVADNQWHLLVGVIRGATDMDLYVDCINDGGYYNGSGGGLAYSSGNMMHIAHSRCSSNDFYYQGVMDEFRFYHRELTQADVNALYNFPTVVSSTNMAANVLGPDTYLCAGQYTTLNATTSWGATYNWSNGSTGSTLSTNQTGIYWVDIMGSGCGQHGRDTIEIKNAANYDVLADTSICKGQVLTLTSTPNANGYSWNTGATTQSITISNAGTYYVNLPFSPSCSLVDTIHVSNGGNAPYANYTYVFQANGMIQFTNTSSYGIDYQWYFNGIPDTNANPLHYFPCNTPIQVMLTASNDCGIDTLTKTISNDCGAIDLFADKIKFLISPIPAQESLNLEYELTQKCSVSIQIYDEMGRNLLSNPAQKQIGQIKTSLSLAIVLYKVYY